MARSKDHKDNFPPIFGTAALDPEVFSISDLTRSEWISRKIRKLRAEGKSQEQAVAIAHQMWRDRQKKKRKKK